MNNIGNRNSTPETSTSSSLRPPSSTRTSFGTGHHLRASADMGSQSNESSSSRVGRPSSEVYTRNRPQGPNEGNPDDPEKKAQQWLADIDSYETTLEEMAAATLDQDFKDELSAIEQWFRVLSEAERTAALYALLQQATQVQTRFFIGVLQQMAQSHPMSGMLSPSGFEKDTMSNRLSTAMNRLSVEGSRHSGYGRPPQTPGVKRNSGLDQAEINSMFPDAAAAIAKEKADFTQRTGTEPRSNRSSAVVGDRSSLVAPTISAPHDDMTKKEGHAQPMPWGANRSGDNAVPASARPKSSSGQQPMGQFAQQQQPPPSAGMRSARSMGISGDRNINNQTADASGLSTGGLPMMSPYGGGNWASMVNTPMVANFSPQTNPNQADMVANATAMKLAALSTVNSRVQLDDVRKYRRARSSGDNNGNNNVQQMLSPQQAAALQAQHLAAMHSQRDRSSSPAGGVPPSAGMSVSSGGFLSPDFAAQNGIMNMGYGSLGGIATGMGGSGDDYRDSQRGRSPRGPRGTSRPPEDPTDPELLKDIPAWLRSLRLHKYTDNLKDMKWQDLVQLDEKGLEDRGVAAKGARTKMLKVFEEVKEAQAKGKI